MAQEVEKARKDTGHIHYRLSDKDLVSDLEKDHLRGLWTDAVLDNYLEHVKSCCVREGSSFIYRLWKSLLLRWLTDADTRVVMVTERLDAPRLRDCVDLSLLRKGTAGWETLLVPNLSDPPRQSRSEIQREVLEDCTPQEALWVEYHVFSRMRAPKTRIHANWIAGLRLGECELLLTSCDFHGDAFDQPGGMATVQFVRLSELMYNHEFMHPLTGTGGESSVLM